MSSERCMQAWWQTLLTTGPSCHSRMISYSVLLIEKKLICFQDHDGDNLCFYSFICVGEEAYKRWVDRRKLCEWHSSFPLFSYWWLGEQSFFSWEITSMATWNSIKRNLPSGQSADGLLEREASELSASSSPGIRAASESSSGLRVGEAAVIIACPVAQRASPWQYGYLNL